MGQSATETVREIETVRGRLEDSIRELENRLPEAAKWGRRAVGYAAVTGGAIAALVLTKKMFGKRRKPEPTTVVQLVPPELPDGWAHALHDGTWKPYAAAAAGVWFAFKLADLRYRRRIAYTAYPKV